MLLQDANDLLFGSYRSLQRPSLPLGGLSPQTEEKIPWQVNRNPMRLIGCDLHPKHAPQRSDGRQIGGFAMLGCPGLRFDIHLHHWQMEELLGSARSFPDAPIHLNRFVIQMDGSDLCADLHRGMDRLAKAPSVAEGGTALRSE